MTKIKFLTSSPEQIAAWDAFVLNHPDSGPYHRWGWGGAIEQAYGHQSFNLAVVDSESENIQGILPLVLMKTPLLKPKLVSLPFCDYAGPLVLDCSAVALLVAEACRLAEKFKADLDLRLSTPLQNSDNGLCLHGEKVRLLLQLPGDSKKMFDFLKTKVRTKVRRASKAGCYVKLGGRELLVPFYRVFARNMHDLGSPVHSFAWFDRVFAAFGADIRLGVVYYNKKPICAGIILQHRNRVAIPWSSGLREYNRMKPNMLLYWTFLAYAADGKFDCFDFGRSDPGSGTYNFKTQWGARPQELFWYATAKQAGMRRSSKGRFHAREYAATAWSKLPAPAADWLGPRLRKYISL